MPIPPPAPRPPSPPAIVHERSPPNAEPPPGALLADGVYTRLKTAFWRNHAGLPGVGFEEDWELRVSSAAVGGGGEEGEEKEVWKGGLRELHERWGGSERRLRVALQCAGNRRDELSQIHETEGIQWSSGTISNHLFTGYPVRAVLLDLGVPERAPSAAGSGGTGEGWHVHFESGVGPEDPEGGKAWYGCSLPYEAVMSADARPNLLAFEANGERLPLEHGRPLRLVTPGVIGARSIKWLERIRVLPYASKNEFQTHDYKVLPPTLVAPTADEKRRALDAAEPMMAFGISCACLVAGPAEAKGWAIGSDGVPIDRVEVAHVPSSAVLPPSASPTDVRIAAALLPPASWTPAALERGPDEDGDGEREWGWVLWTAPAPADGWVVARCVDRAGHVQEPEGLWNLRGVGNGAWSVKRVHVEDAAPAPTS